MKILWPENEVSQGFRKSYKFSKMLKIRWFLSKSCIVEAVSYVNAVRRHRDCRQLSQINIVELSLISSAVSRRCKVHCLKQIMRHQSCRMRMVLSGMLGAESFRRAGSDHRAV